MAYKIEPGETLRDGVRRILLEKIDESIELLTRPYDDPDEAIHEARKNCKRLRAVVRLVRDDIGEDVYKRENVTFRDAARRLAPLRDSYVLIETLDRLVERFPDRITADDVAGIHQKLVAQHAAIRDQLIDTEDATAEAMEMLRGARDRIETMEIPSDGVDAFYDGLRRVYKRGRNAMAEAYEVETEAELFHEWRKRVKYLWYQTEILEIIWPQLMVAIGDELHEISNYLGDGHDFAVLTTALHDQPDVFADEPLELVTELGIARRRELEEAARPLGERMYAEKKYAFVDRISAYWRVWETHEYNGLGAPADPDADPASALLSTGEAAERLGISTDDLREQIRDGRIPAQKVGNVWVIRAAALPDKTLLS